MITFRGRTGLYALPNKPHFVGVPAVPPLPHLVDMVNHNEPGNRTFFRRFYMFHLKCMYF